MSPKNPMLTVGLTALGWLGVLAAQAAPPEALPMPSGLPAVLAPSSPPTVLLKSNGQILSGVITREEGKYLVSVPGGEIRVADYDVEGVFPSLTAIYQHKLASIPDNDPDEHLKIARWCLSHKLNAEARAELKHVLVLSPNAREAKAMLVWVDSSSARLAARPRVDAGLMQTGGQLVERSGKGAGTLAAPAEIDPSVLHQARRELGVRGVPVIFDLPPALAAKRTDQFARIVHPVLQRACAKCHNEQHEGKFQLVEVRTPRDNTSNVLRSNLDATLQLIDPENPVRSELLSSTLLPHGNGTNKRPIFRGSNDPRFQILVTWVASLRVGTNRAPAEGRFADPAAPAPTPNGGGSPFGVDRGPGTTSSSLPANLTNPVKGYPFSTPVEARQPVRFVPGRGMVAEKTPPTDDEFPVPFLLGGPKPKRDDGTRAAGASMTPAAPGLPPLPTTPTTPRGLPLNDPTLSPPSSPIKNPVKIDPAVLERALLNRNSDR